MKHFHPSDDFYVWCLVFVLAAGLAWHRLRRIL